MHSLKETNQRAAGWDVFRVSFNRQWWRGGQVSATLQGGSLCSVKTLSRHYQGAIMALFAIKTLFRLSLPLYRLCSFLHSLLTLFSCSVTSLLWIEWLVQIEFFSVIPLFANQAIAWPREEREVTHLSPRGEIWKNSQHTLKTFIKRTEQSHTKAKENKEGERKVQGNFFPHAAVI